MSERKSMYVPVKMTPAELAALRSMADERSCSVGAVVRWAVRKALANEIAQTEQANTGDAMHANEQAAHA